MECPACRTLNREGAKFCLHCGGRLELFCPHCDSAVPPAARFCDACGNSLDLQGPVPGGGDPVESERKQVTVFFSDLSGYSSLVEKTDPEEAREIMSRIFGEISQIVARHGGLIEKFIGDAAVAVFGVPRTEESDPVRAVQAALDVHTVVSGLSRRYEKKLGFPLAMHTGIHTGVVVTGETDLATGKHGLSGETFTLASRLCGLADPGEIIVSQDTCRRSDRYFRFDEMDTVTVKGREEPIRPFRVAEVLHKPASTHRVTGLRSRFIGRRRELEVLEEFNRQLLEGRGGVVLISGEAGIGKSRLVEEFRASTYTDQAVWLEGHSYSHTRNIPYFPLIDLLGGAFDIDEGASPEKAMEKISAAVGSLPGCSESVAPYLGSLFGTSHPDLEGGNPEFWKARLFESVQEALTCLARRSPTVVFLNDLHWADPSSVSLFRALLQSPSTPALFMAVYRPIFTLFERAEEGTGRRPHREILLAGLSPSETLGMVRSILRSENVPVSLLKLVRERFEDNPFYVEEGINYLVETGALFEEGGLWNLGGKADLPGIPPTVQGILSARIDRLPPRTKRVAQEASVIGRSFPLGILRQVTDRSGNLEEHLRELAKRDLLRLDESGPEAGYTFKHALTQEVIYEGLLRKERRLIHEKTAAVIEGHYRDRLADVYETLAYHYRHGTSRDKAIDYLTRSSGKSVDRYALEEAHLYCREAFELLEAVAGRTREEKNLLVDLLVRWAFVYHYRGDFKGLVQLLKDFEHVVRETGDERRLGRFCTQLGLALYQSEHMREAERYQREALRIGERTGDRWIIGYACSYLSWVLSDLGQLDDALACGERAVGISPEFPDEEFLYWNSMAGVGMACYFRGDVDRGLEAGRELLDFGWQRGSKRSVVLGHYIIGNSLLASGDLSQAVTSFEEAVDASADPWFSQFPRLSLGLTLLTMEKFEQAGEAFEEVLQYSRKFETMNIGRIAEGLAGVVAISRGKIKEGIETLQAAVDIARQKERSFVFGSGEHTLGKVYARISEGGNPFSVALLHNPVFLFRTVTQASRQAEKLFTSAIETAERIGARGLAGLSYLERGELRARLKDREGARRDIGKANALLETCGRGPYLDRARAAMFSPEGPHEGEGG